MMYHTGNSLAGHYQVHSQSTMEKHKDIDRRKRDIIMLPQPTIPRLILPACLSMDQLSNSSQPQVSRTVSVIGCRTF